LKKNKDSNLNFEIKNKNFIEKKSNLIISEELYEIFIIKLKDELFKKFNIVNILLTCLLLIIKEIINKDSIYINFESNGRNFENIDISKTINFNISN
jgi:hypothetical protein